MMDKEIKNILIAMFVVWLLLFCAIFFVIEATDWNEVANSTGKIIGEVRNGIESAVESD